MAFEDLQNYVPPYQAMDLYYEDASMVPWIASIRSNMGNMDSAELNKTITEVERAGADVEKALKEAKRKVGNPSYKDDQDAINSKVGALEEEDAQITEVLADLTQKLNAAK